MSSTYRHILTLGDYSLQRELCHRVKTSSLPSLREAAGKLAAGLDFPADGVLIPVPSHLGTATDTLLLCNELSRLTGLPVCDALTCSGHDSLYLLKKAGSPLPDITSMDFRLKAELPTGLRPLLVDNVISTGTTMKGALSAVPGGIPCSIAIDYARLILQMPRCVLPDYCPIY